MIDTFEEKIIDNDICACNRCGRLANIRIKFSLGFSARFCNKCAETLIKDKVATEMPENPTKKGNHPSAAVNCNGK